MDIARVAVLITTDAERRGVFAGSIDVNPMGIVRSGLVELTNARTATRATATLAIAMNIHIGTSPVAEGMGDPGTMPPKS